MSEVRICANELCGKEFVSLHPLAKTCCEECRKLYRSQQAARRYRASLEKKAPAAPSGRLCKRCGKPIIGRRADATYCSECKPREEKRIKGAGFSLNSGKPKKQQKKTQLTGVALMKAQGVLVTGKSSMQLAEEARALGMTAGKYKAMLQMQYEKEMGIGFYAT